jgi:hypothetical protein
MAQHDDRRNIEQDHREPIDRRAEEVFDRVVAHRSRDIDIGIRVMQRVKAPEEWHRVLAAVYEVMQKVEEQETGQEAQRSVADRPRRELWPERCLEPRARR